MIDQIAEIDTTARTLYGEDRNGGRRGMEAVACVIMNRVAIAKHYVGKFGKPHPEFGNGTFVACCKSRMQFDCWNGNDPNYQKICAVTESDPVFAQCMEIAASAVNGDLIDITNGASYYYAKTMDAPPYWAKGKTPCADIGGQLFFNNIN